MKCNRCSGTGFLNIDDIEEDIAGLDNILSWIDSHYDHDVCICDCCGDGYSWYGAPGEHYTSEDMSGMDGPYAYNGGLCECN